MILAKNKSTHPKLSVLLLFFLVEVLFFGLLFLQTHASPSDMNHVSFNLDESTSEEFTFTEVGQWVEEGVYALDVAVEGDIAYVCTFDYLAILDVSDSTNPSLLGTFNQFGNYDGEIPWPTQVIAYGDYVFVKAYWHDPSYCWTNKIMVLDVSNPSNPLFVQEFNIQKVIYDICLIDNFLYVTSGGDFHIYDVEDASSPSLLGSYSGKKLYHAPIGIHESYAFLGSHSDGYSVLDISNPANPFIVKNCTDFSITDIYFVGSIAYTLTRNTDIMYSGRNFTIFRLTDSYDLEEINRFNISENIRDFIFSDGYAYMQSYDNDFLVLKATNFNHLEYVYQSNEEDLDAEGFTITGYDFYLAAGAEGLIIYQVYYPPITISLNQSAFLIFFVGVSAFLIFLKRKRR